MVFTFSKRHFISLHFAKKKCMKIDQVRAEIQLAKHYRGRPVRSGGAAAPLPKKSKIYKLSSYSVLRKVLKKL